MKRGEEPQEAVVMRALVVDDDPAIRTVLCEMCRSVGLAVESAADGVEALEHLRRHGADIMLLDVSMPRLGGFGVLEELHKNPLQPSPAIVMVTSHNDVSAKMRGAELGAIDHIDKPFRLADVQRRIQRVVAVTDLERRLADEESVFSDLRGTDQDTGVGSFAQLSSTLDGEFRWAQAQNAPLTCVVISDERYRVGGNAHERLEDQGRLQEATKVIAEAVADTGRLFRVDAAELVVLMPRTPEEGARELVARVVACLAADDDLDPGDFVIGAATYPHHDIDQPTHLYRAANLTLAQARVAQGDRVRYFAGFPGDSTEPDSTKPV